MKKDKALNVTGNIYTMIGAILCFAAIALLAYPQLPYVFNKLNINSPEKEAESLNTPITTEPVANTIVPTDIPQITLPEKDISLIEKNSIVISRIGVKAEIIAGEDSVEALKKGPWIVYGYADPEQNYLGETSKSIIIASHRFGYSSWSTEYRNTISFFNLPQTTVGDHITIIWNQREYVYEITATDESKYIKDVDADLILYTCKYYNSPTRIFRFANLISINGNPV